MLVALAVVCVCFVYFTHIQAYTSEETMQCEIYIMCTRMSRDWYKMQCNLQCHRKEKRSGTVKFVGENVLSVEAVTCRASGA